MKKSSTREDYYTRICRVNRYIADHIFEDLRVETLAEIAAFSPFHFHRIYRMLARETVNESIRRQRLHHAAGKLVRTEIPVAEIAKSVCYTSVAAFTRAFSQRYGQSPAAYRDQRTLVSPLVEYNDEDIKMTPEVTISDRTPMRLAAIRHTGSYMEIGHAFEQVSTWAMSKDLFGPNTRMVGVYWDDPQSVETKDLRSDAGLTVDPDFAGDPAVSTIDIPALKTASVVHQGPYAELEKTYRWFYGTWLPASGEEAGDFPPFEEYLNDPKSTPPADLRTRINMPLAG